VNLRESYVEQRKNVHPKFKNVLNALPQDKFHYKPHDRSPSTTQIVWTMTLEMKALIDMIDSGTLSFTDQAPPAPPEMLRLFHQYYDELLHKASKMSDADWNKQTKFVYGGNVLREAPYGAFLFNFHQDMIHHRGQLAAYLRPMGGKVPSIYGPSADDPGH
jgi:uncharacterized damage-inducible protein DinB